MFDFEQVESFGRSPPAQYLFTCGSPPKQKHKKSGSVKVRNRDRRRQAAAELAELDGEEAAALEAQLGVAACELPPHLRGYALRRRSEACFSGPGLLPVEQEVGHVEYKLRLLDPTPSRFQQLVTQLNWRLSEGSGECLYALGVEDNGHPRGLDAADLAASLEVLQAMAAEVGAEAEVLQTPPGAREGRRCAVVRLVRAAAPAPRFDDVRVAVAGGVDSGKSTLVGVLCHGAGGAPLLDNGRGAARLRVFRHKHECESGHTSSVSLQQCCYDVQGRVLNYLGLSSLTPAEAAASAARMLRFFDLGGHERFSKTLLHGLTAMLPDHVLLCVSAVAGVPWATREHLAAALALGIPLLVAITKADLAGEAAVAAVADDIRSLLASAVRQGGGTPGDPSAIAPLVQTEEQARQLAAGARQSAVESLGAPLRVPLFPVSAVTGASLQLLHAYFTALPPSDGSRPRGCQASMQGWLQPAAPPAAAGDGTVQQASSHFQIDGSFEVADVGTVYSGTVVAGSLRMGQQLLLGPLEGGEFRRVAITGIHRSKVDVREAAQGQHATLAVQPLDAHGEEGGDAGAADAASQGLPPPPRGDSVGCLHAWMAQSAGEAGTPPLAIGGPARLPRSSLTAQLAGSVGGTLPRSAAGSSPQLTPLGSSSTAPKPRKGAVLLDPSLAPTPCSRFEAVLVLLGGCWPPRGLLTGCFPPEGDGDDDDVTEPPRTPADSDAGGSSPGGGWQGGCSSGRLARGPSRRRLAAYVPVVHCGSIRQAAQVVAVRELSLPAGPDKPAEPAGPDRTDPARCGGCGDLAGRGEGQEAGPVAGPGLDEELLAGLDPLGEPSGGSSTVVPGGGPACPAHDALHPGHLAGAVAAAGVLLPEALPARGAAGGTGASGACSSGGASGADTPMAAGGAGGLPLAAALELQRSAAASQDVGCVAAVTFAFMHQPEWLVEGARLIVRDHASGRIAGAGYVAAVHP